MKHNIQNASPFKTKQLGDKLNKVIDTSREWRPPTRTDADLKHKSHATLYYDKNQYPSAPSGFIG